MTLVDRWNALPDTVKGPVKSAVFSAGLAVQTAFFVLVGAAAADGHIASPGDLLGYIETHWWGVVVGLILPAAYRAREKFNHIQTGGTP